MSFLFVDQILDLTPGKRIVGIKEITRQDHYLKRDKEGKHYFPGTLIGETLGQLAAWNVMHTNNFTLRPVAGVVAKASLIRGAYMGDCLRLESVIEALDERAVLYNSSAWINDALIVHIEGALGPLLPMEEFIDRNTVCAQFNALFSKNDKIHQNLSRAQDRPQIRNEETLMAFDQIIQKDKESLIAVKWVDPKAPYLPCHFPRKPVLPMTILLESKIHLAEQFLAQCTTIRQYSIKELRKIKMNVFVHPEDLLKCQVTIKERTEQQIILNFRSEVNQKRVCVLEMVISYE